MGLTQLDIIWKQMESAAKNRVAGETAKIRRKTSLIDEVSRLTGKANRTLDQAGQEVLRRRANRRPKIQKERGPSAQTERSKPTSVCADGYVRRSPEQPLYTPPDYRRKLIRQALSAAVLVVLALAVVWLLLRFSVFSI